MRARRRVGSPLFGRNQNWKTVRRVASRVECCNHSWKWLRLASVRGRALGLWGLNSMVNVLGVSCSLRNARYGQGSERLIAEVHALANEADLGAYLETQTKIRLDDFIAAGRGEDLSFDEIYRRLRKSRNDRGVSNSEAALVAGL